eukprot:3330320-Pleurochrysis_carterae.AAC.4
MALVTRALVCLRVDLPLLFKERVQGQRKFLTCGVSRNTMTELRPAWLFCLLKLSFAQQKVIATSNTARMQGRVSATLPYH